jgi:hypothetical protein
MKLFQLFAFPLLALSIISCNNELDINADYKEIAVVYSLLDPKLDTQWVRIERGYLGNKPASASFDEPDSLFYENVTAELIEFDENGNETRIPLFRDDTSRQRNDNGPFTQNAFRLYRTNGITRLNPFYTYNLQVETGSETPTIHVESNINIIRATTTSPSGSPDLLDIRKPIQTASMAVPPVFLGAIEWEDHTGFRSEVIVGFHYTEYNPTTKEKVYKSFERNLGTTRDNSIDYRYSSLYQNIANNIQPNPQVIRFFEKLSIRVTVIGREVDTYARLNIPTTGIIQSRPEYTNLENAIGVFSSRTSAQQDSVLLNETVKTQMILDKLVCDLRFARISSGDTLICNNAGGDNNALVPYR